MNSAATNRWMFLSLLVVVTLWTALPARADDWSKTFNLTGKPDLRVETSDANIHVYSWEQNTIEAKVTTRRFKIGDNGIRIEDHQNGDSVELSVHYPHHVFSISYRDSRVDVDIHMPREGRVNLHTGDGKIEIRGIKGEIELRSSDGSQTIDAVDGKLRASTGDGHIRANGRFDEVELKTGDGGVEVRAASGSTLATGWRLESGDGNVTVEVPAGLAADLDLHTGDGHIELDMPVTTEGKFRANEIRGKINGGGPMMTIRTSDGSIHLRKG